LKYFQEQYENCVQSFFIFVSCQLSRRCPHSDDEIFGPILPILRVRDAGEAVAFVNARPKPLALYVFSGDSDVPQRFVDETSSGGVCVNDCLWVRPDEKVSVCV
jgi:acyl-CoA reductase-like NAD-dependent aldehyde dehydrogenase